MARARSSFAEKARTRRRARKRKPKKIPPRAARYVKSVHEARGPALAFQIGMRRLFDGFAKAVRGALYHRLDEWAKAEPERSDAKDDKPPRVKGLRGPALRAVSAKAVDKITGKVAAATEKHSGDEFKRIGVSLREEPRLNKVIDDWRATNVARVSGLAEEELTTLESVLAESEGRTVKEIKAKIEERLDVTKSKAEYLARNQVSSLNARITQERQQAAGIEEFIWTTAGDERVRPSHAAIDGKRYRWDDPPEVDDYEAIPGDPPNCRCTAYPVLAELEGLEDDDADTAA